MDEVKIRDFTFEDLTELANLTTELGYPTTALEMQARMQVISIQPGYKTVVAVSNTQIVGYMGMSKQYLWEQNGHFVRIQALVVKNGVRRMGIGQKLIEHAEDWAKQINALLIALNCGNRMERENAHRFYPKMGFTAKSTGYVKLVHRVSSEVD